MAAKSNIVLIGMPGAGKSSMGVVAAKMLGMDFVDADLIIQNKFGRTLARLIEELGAEGFIEIEGETLREIACDHTVIATGGSAIYSEDAMQYLHDLGTIVYLQVGYDELVERLGELAERGVVMRESSGTTLADLYAERIPLYEQWADITIPCDGLSIRETAESLIDTL